MLSVGYKGGNMGAVTSSSTLAITYFFEFLKKLLCKRAAPIKVTKPYYKPVEKLGYGAKIVRMILDRFTQSRL